MENVSASSLFISISFTIDQQPETHSPGQGASGIETFPTGFSENPSLGGGERMSEFRKTP